MRNDTRSLRIKPDVVTSGGGKEIEVSLEKDDEGDIGVLKRFGARFGRRASSMFGRS